MCADGPELAAAIPEKPFTRRCGVRVLPVVDVEVLGGLEECRALRLDELAADGGFCAARHPDGARRRLSGKIPRGINSPTGLQQDHSQTTFGQLFGRPGPCRAGTHDDCVVRGFVSALHSHLVRMWGGRSYGTHPLPLPGRSSPRCCGNARRLLATDSTSPVSRRKASYSYSGQVR